MNNFEIIFRPTFYSKKRKLEFTDEYLNLYSGNVLQKRIHKNEIKALRYGIKWIEGSHLGIGRVYGVFLGNLKKNIIAIKLSSIYGVNKQKLGLKYNEIIDKLFAFYFNDFIYDCLVDIENGKDVEIADIVFNKKGVLLDNKIADGFLTWEDMDSKVYTHYYALSSKKRPDFYKAFTYLTDWNAVLVYYISRKILISKGLYTEKE